VVSLVMSLHMERTMQVPVRVHAVYASVCLEFMAHKILPVYFEYQCSLCVCCLTVTETEQILYLESV
jgi:hypothetical protein